MIHCTNARAGLLLPELAPNLTPNRAQAHSLIPAASLSGSNIISSTFSLRYSQLHFYSLIQRKGDGALILGVSRHNPTLSETTQQGNVSIDDSKYNDEILQNGLRQLQKLFPGAMDAEETHGGGVGHAWTGIIAMTADSVPFVGALENLPGQYICAGHNGQGKSYCVSRHTQPLTVSRDGADIHLCAGDCKVSPGRAMERYGLTRMLSSQQEEVGKIIRRISQTDFIGRMKSQEFSESWKSEPVVK